MNPTWTWSGRAAAAAGLWLMSLIVPSANAAGTQSLSLGTGVSTFYDGNILSYSDGQIAQFETGAQPTHFSIESTGDAVFNPSASLLWELDQGHGRRHSLRLRGEGDFHGRNATADFHSLSTSWRESFRRDRRLSLGYYILPKYYLRQLLDEDIPVAPGVSRYRRATYRLQIGTAGWDQRLTRNTELSLDYRFEARTYNPDFKERTSGLHQGAVGLAWNRLPRRGGVSVRGGYRVSNAKAVDGDSADVAGTPDDQDVSYHGFVAGLGGRMELARGQGWGLIGDLRYELETRDYASDRPFDTNHFGRSDVLNAVELGLRTEFRSHWSMRGFYRYENNRASLGSGVALSTDPASYAQDQVGLAVEWSGEIWSRAQDAPTDSGGEN